MPSTPISSAPILSRIIESVDFLMTATDDGLAAEEMALGINITPKSLQLGFGLAPCEPIVAGSLSSTAIGVGAVRVADDMRCEVLNATHPFQSIHPHADWLGDVPVSNAYAFASACLMHYLDGDQPVTVIQVIPILGGEDSSGSNLLMTSDTALEEVLEMSRHGDIPAVNPPVTGDQFVFVELFRVVLAITSYDPSSPSTAEFTQHVVDVRRPRGLAGFADELLAGSLTVATINQREALATHQAQADASLYNLISKWVDLSSWSPDFVSYWTANASSMPSRLRQYLLDELSINLP